MVGTSAGHHIGDICLLEASSRILGRWNQRYASRSVLRLPADT